MNKKNILIVEDDFLNRRLTKKVLNEMDYEVLEAKNTVVALELLKKESIELAILDINLGENERNGINLGQQIQDEFKIPFIYLTAYENPKIIGEAIKTAPHSYLTKPFKNSDLVAAVELALFNGHLPKTTIMVKDGEFKVELAINEIDHIESEGNYLLISTVQKTFRYRSTISQILEVLPAKLFVQTHRAFVVNKTKIEKFNAQNVVIKNTPIPLSKKYQKNLQ
ncbi:DNA-binding response regulator [Lacihabitans sp. LS3-19]|uniref:LytR/AlgR family response regulator transcription factor n=1 Tax=Lacihabitans sp. LS3-19 TaxID=2487335 RepID=UPI0020CD8A63|nr:response regulator transcription factor [Lacihabitans sp. LS3-19]MCP9767160.1 DNA-binding response regulator [Lacihabitans sp. LS3-19]